MNLYTDELVQLNYVPEQNILYAAWQEHRDYSAAEVKKAFMSVVACARDYNITCVMLNFANNTHDLTEEEYKTALAQLTVGLLPTPIRKIACIGTNSDVRKDRIMHAFHDIEDHLHLPLEFRFFSNTLDALYWLEDKEYLPT